MKLQIITYTHFKHPFVRRSLRHFLTSKTCSTQPVRATTHAQHTSSYPFASSCIFGISLLRGAVNWILLHLTHRVSTISRVGPISSRTIRNPVRSREREATPSALPTRFHLKNTPLYSEQPSLKVKGWEEGMKLIRQLINACVLCIKVQVLS